ncbi:MAG: hypothetical protein HKN40_01260 [Winogradskyella sp.]|uniref:hypothetical protein n=1 Tax=Winogradskyella sp. TaxID=1883156 RepID=UPI0018146550|nr:hypothetical protein [Winogradskyella sp.]
MSFGGSAQAMITTLKNNAKMRSTRDKFKKTLGGYRSNPKPEYNLPEATPKMLNDIRVRIKRENRSRRLKIIVSTIVIVATLASLLFI